MNNSSFSVVFIYVNAMDHCMQLSVLYDKYRNKCCMKLIIEVFKRSNEDKIMRVI